MVETDFIEVASSAGPNSSVKEESVTVRDVARRLEISVSLVYQLVESEKLRCTRHGLGRGVIRVSDEQMADYLAMAERGSRPAPPESTPSRTRLKPIRF
jgi:excisionase family DNA binding protein